MHEEEDLNYLLSNLKSEDVVAILDKLIAAKEVEAPADS